MENIKQLKFLFVLNFFVLFSCSDNSSKEIETPEEATENPVVNKIENDSIVKNNLTTTDTVKQEKKNENSHKNIEEKLPYTGVTFVSPKKYEVGSDAWKKAMKRDSSYRVLIESKIAVHGEMWAENHFDPNIQRVYNEYYKK